MGLKQEEEHYSTRGQCSGVGCEKEGMQEGYCLFLSPCFSVKSCSVHAVPSPLSQP